MRKRCTIIRLSGSSDPIRATKKLFKIVKPVAKITMQHNIKINER
jgi:hypothetical protein